MTVVLLRHGAGQSGGRATVHIKAGARWGTLK